MLAESNTPETKAASPPAIRRAVLQWNLRTLFLLTAVVAVWLAYFRFRQEDPRLEHQIALMREMAHELIVEDRQQAAVVRLPGLWDDETRWDVYLPEGDYTIRLATRGIDAEELASSEGEASLHSGRHRVELRQSKFEVSPSVSVFVDKELVVEITEDSDWFPGEAWLGGGRFVNSQQLPASDPVVLYRRRFAERQSDGAVEIPENPNGILLWIEQINPTQSTSQAP